MKPMYTYQLTDDEHQFFVQLFNSKMAVTLDTVEIIAALKAKVLSASKTQSVVTNTPSQVQS